VDLKEMYCERADELAMELYDKEFYDLPKNLQDKVWLMAEQGVVDGLADHADMLRKAQKEEML